MKLDKRLIALINSKAGSGGEIDLTNFYTKEETGDLLNNKVDKVSGKGLSTHDYTTADKI